MSAVRCLVFAKSPRLPKEVANPWRPLENWASALDLFSGPCTCTFVVGAVSVVLTGSKENKFCDGTLDSGIYYLIPVLKAVAALIAELAICNPVPTILPPVLNPVNAWLFLLSVSNCIFLCLVRKSLLSIL